MRSLCEIASLRCAKNAMNPELDGPVISTSSYFMKAPPQQFIPDVAHQMVEEFIKG